MKFYRDLLDRAGLHHQIREISWLIFGSAVLVFATVSVFTDVVGLGLCLAVMAIASAIELVRIRALSRQRNFDASWPQIFDSLQTGVATGMGAIEQFEYLSQKGPASHQKEFREAFLLLDQGRPLEEVLNHVKISFSSRQADLMVFLLSLELEIGGIGMTAAFANAAEAVRKEQSELGQLLSKQGWVSLSAKIALLAPWVIALVLIQLEQNRTAFATELGSVVLVLGLALSLAAYFLVNRLGYLPMPTRVLNGH